MDSEWDYVQTVNDLKDQYDACKSYYENKILKLEYKIKRLTNTRRKERSVRIKTVSGALPGQQHSKDTTPFCTTNFSTMHRTCLNLPRYADVYCSLDMTRD